MEPSTTRGEEAMAGQFQLHRWSHAMNQRHEASGQEIEWWRHLATAFALRAVDRDHTNNEQEAAESAEEEKFSVSSVRSC